MKPLREYVNLYERQLHVCEQIITLKELTFTLFQVIHYLGGISHNFLCQFLNINNALLQRYAHLSLVTVCILQITSTVRKKYMVCDSENKQKYKIYCLSVKIIQVMYFWNIVPLMEFTHHVLHKVLSLVTIYIQITTRYFKAHVSKTYHAYKMPNQLSVKLFKLNKCFNMLSVNENISFEEFTHRVFTNIEGFLGVTQ